MVSEPSIPDWLAGLRTYNFYSIYDVVSDVHQELELTEADGVEIPLLPSIVRFKILMPSDGINFRDRYCDFRWKAAHLLEKKGVLKRFRSSASDIDGKVDYKLFQININLKIFLSL